MLDPAQAFVDVAVLNEKAPKGITLVGDFILAQDDFGRAFWYHFRTPQNRVELIGPRRDTVQVSSWIICLLALVHRALLHSVHWMELLMA